MDGECRVKENIGERHEKRNGKTVKRGKVGE